MFPFFGFLKLTIIVVQRSGEYVPGVHAIRLWYLVQTLLLIVRIRFLCSIAHLRILSVLKRKYRNFNCFQKLITGRIYVILRRSAHLEHRHKMETFSFYGFMEVKIPYSEILEVYPHSHTMHYN